MSQTFSCFQMDIKVPFLVDSCMSKSIHGWILLLAKHQTEGYTCGKGSISVDNFLVGFTLKPVRLWLLTGSPCTCTCRFNCLRHSKDICNSFCFKKLLLRSTLGYKIRNQSCASKQTLKSLFQTPNLSNSLTTDMDRQFDCGFYPRTEPPITMNHYQYGCFSK